MLVLYSEIHYENLFLILDALNPSDCSLNWIYTIISTDHESRFVNLLTFFSL